MTAEFLDFTSFLEYSAADDRQFLNEGGLHRLPAVMCAMANSLGGWIVLGVEQNEESHLKVTGLENKPELPAQNLFSEHIEFEAQELNSPSNILIIIINVKQLPWHKRPVSVFEQNGNVVYRRVEGENLISGMVTKSFIALDALNLSGDDVPARNTNIDTEKLSQFTEAIITHQPHMAEFDTNELLKRCFIYSGKFLTRAGHLMFGENSVLVRTELYYRGTITLEAHNLWEAYHDMLPRLTLRLSHECAEALYEIFINALLHSDYGISNCIDIEITGAPARICIKNPGMAKTLSSNESVCRNPRLMKIFKLLNAARGTASGYKIIRKYQPDFNLVQDMLDLSVTASINLRPGVELPGPILL